MAAAHKLAHDVLADVAGGSRDQDAPRLAARGFVVAIHGWPHAATERRSAASRS
jgi:hypothetical protein